MDVVYSKDQMVSSSLSENRKKETLDKGKANLHG